MKRSVCIELVEEYETVSYYAVRFNEDESSLFDQFLAKFRNARYIDDLHLIAYWMERIGVEGPLVEYVRDEGHMFTKALPIDSSSLRLYCYILKDTNFILLGGGDVKNVRTYQQDPVLNRHVQIVKKVGNKILRYLELGKINVTENHLLEGKMCFDIEL